jgi:thiol:disulfide interchange protein
VADTTTPEQLVQNVRQSSWSEGIPWQPWQPGWAETLSAHGFTVYVDYTADWCLTCQSNKKLVLETEDLRREMQVAGVIPIKADFTKRNRVMAEEIERHGNPTVPLNLVYPPGAPQRPIKLPVLLTKEIVRAALEQAGSSRQ